MLELVLSPNDSPRRSSARALRQGKSFRGRIFDVAVSALALMLFGPLLLLLGLAIYIEDGGPIFFAQSRLGFGGRTFRCFKLRTMCVDADARLSALLENSAKARIEWERDHKLKIDPRTTWLGAILRKTSLDELPQFINILMGDMTLVGPRPIVKDEVWRYGKRYNHYCAVKPGLTGLWQVSGRNDTSYRSRVAMDVVYSRRRGAILDLKILAATIPAVILRRGSY